MVSNITLTQIHMRLVEIFKPESPEVSFANQNILLFGDLLQVKKSLKYHLIFKKCNVLIY